MPVLSKEFKLGVQNISHSYDSISGSKYLHVIAAQLSDRVIDMDDLERFNEDVRKKIIFLSGINSRNDGV